MAHNSKTTSYDCGRRERFCVIRDLTQLTKNQASILWSNLRETDLVAKIRLRAEKTVGNMIILIRIDAGHRNKDFGEEKRF